MHSDSLALVLNSRKPSRFIEMLRTTRKLDQEIMNLIGIPQDSEHHPEGDAYTHTLMVLDEAAEISEREYMTNEENAVLRLAALTHDFGKFTHTQVTHSNGVVKITAHGHPEAGVQPAENFLRNSNVNPRIIAQVLPLVKLHMAWVGFYTPDITSKSVRKLIRKLEPSNLIMLKHVVEADMSGRGGIHYKQGVPQRMYDIIKVADTLDDPVDRYPEPLVTSEDIMELTGIKPSPLLGKVKAALYKAQLEGRFTTREQGIFLLLHHVVIAENS
jgi:hypothetical protein